MFAEFTGKNGKSLRIDTEAVLAVEELDSGCRIYIGGGSIEVRESLQAVMTELETEDDDDDED
jgi:hypothetical protein